MSRRSADIFFLVTPTNHVTTRRARQDHFELELSEDAIKPWGGIRSGSEELFGNPPPLESFRGAKSRARDAFPAAFLLCGEFFL
jgi:hypothetical protein